MDQNIWCTVQLQINMAAEGTVVYYIIYNK